MNGTPPSGEVPEASEASPRIQKGGLPWHHRSGSVLREARDPMKVNEEEEITPVLQPDDETRREGLARREDSVRTDCGSEPSPDPSGARVGIEKQIRAGNVADLKIRIVD